MSRRLCNVTEGFTRKTIQPVKRGVLFLQAKEGQCRFITSERPYRCCGEPVTESRSWCSEHRQRVFYRKAPGPDLAAGSSSI
jgi:hypothetical protein